ncbi:MAG: OmpA family protein [Erythrobacter sp.]
MAIRTPIAIIAGALIVTSVAIFGASRSDQDLSLSLANQAETVIEAKGGESITARFRNRWGHPTRHTVLSGGDGLDEGTRDQVAKGVAAIPGVGGVSWSDGSIMAQAGTLPMSPLHCQEDVDALLQARTIRFEESSSTIDKSSRQLIDEVALALSPCLGSIIAITGHTDASGPEPGNLSLSRDRAVAVQQALIDRGIPIDGLRAQGVGSSEPVAGLQPQDPANRRIEFAVVATTPLQPTPVDTPGPR